MSDKPKILYVSDCESRNNALVDQLRQSGEVVDVPSPVRALGLLAKDHFAGIFIGSQHLADGFEIVKLLQTERILEGMPDGVVLLDGDNTILWGNGRLKEWSGRDKVVGLNFYTALSSPEILGPDFCPFHTALATGRPSNSTLRSSDFTG